MCLFTELVDNKHRFISKIMISKAISRTCEDIDEATLFYVEIKVVDTRKLLIKKKVVCPQIATLLVRYSAGFGM